MAEVAAEAEKVAEAQRRLQEGFGDLEVARDRLQQQIATVDASAVSTAGTVGSRVETGSPAQARRRRL